ncbi:hypothetical protein [Ramlibacter alkalitolerans]|uniref:Uncharacterized protein n=1 Tax=Ramlibacter alkalitolerans TaxID=2039631 RepID=A0ABS1JTY2_9BURK|nr:hypothetical protein [Ramlibacter alkalitolerans]
MSNGLNATQRKRGRQAHNREIRLALSEEQRISILRGLLWLRPLPGAVMAAYAQRLQDIEERRRIFQAKLARTSK